MAEQEEEIACAICKAETLADMTVALTLTCGHRFCAPCVLPWFARVEEHDETRKCPYCRRDVTSLLPVNPEESLPINRLCGMFGQLHGPNPLPEDEVRRVRVDLITGVRDHFPHTLNLLNERLLELEQQAFQPLVPPPRPLLEQIQALIDERANLHTVATAFAVAAVFAFSRMRNPREDKKMRKEKGGIAHSQRCETFHLHVNVHYLPPRLGGRKQASVGGHSLV